MISESSKPQKTYLPQKTNLCTDFLTSLKLGLLPTIFITELYNLSLRILFSAKEEWGGNFYPQSGSHQRFSTQKNMEIKIVSIILGRTLCISRQALSKQLAPQRG
nr:MAG TPA: hypothetical protein [Caudoviricetes sp.]